MVRAIVYARFSPRKNAATCLSNETQISICREYCEKQGYEVAAVFEDAAISGKASRKGLRGAIAVLKPGDVLVAYASSRLARNALLLLLTYQQVAKKKASVELVEDGGRISNEPIDICMRTVRAAFDEFDRQMIGKRTSDAMRRHMANGMAMGSSPPYGKMAGPMVESGGKKRRTVVDNDSEQAVIRYIRMLAAGGAGMRAIARQLNEEGIESRGLEWGHVTVSRILARFATCEYKGVENGR